MTESKTLYVRPEKLKPFISTVVQGLQTPARDADFVAAVLVEADLRGVDFHGATRLVGYVEIRDLGLLDPVADVRVLSTNSACTRIDENPRFRHVGSTTWHGVSD